MKAISKLNLNRNPATIVNGELIYAKNVVATKDQKAICNEDGFSLIKTFTKDIIGKVEIPTGYVVFLKGIPDEIVYVSNGTTKTITSSYFNFTNSIKGSYTYNFDGDLIITFSEGVDSPNETRIINLTTSPTTLTQIQVDLLGLTPNIVYPTITDDVIVGGSLLSGTYQICVSYLIQGDTYTNPSILGVPIYVFGNIKDDDKIGNIVNLAINLSFTGLDTRYSKFKLGILYKGLDTTETAYETDDINTSASSYKLSDINSLSIIDIPSLTIGSVSYIKDQGHTNFGGILFRANVKSVNYVGLDLVMADIINELHVGIVYRDADQFTTNPNIKRHFKEGEHYLIYIGCFDYKGNFVNAYPIIWKATDDTEMGLSDNGTTPWTTHKIPYDVSVDTPKHLADLTITLPSNVNTLLGSFASTITSFCYFYAEHDIYNSKIIGQGFGMRDMITNDFSTQTYTGILGSDTKIRFYSFEHLFNKSIISNVNIFNSKKDVTVLDDLTVGVPGADYTKAKFVIDEDSKLIDRNEVVVDSIDFISPNNTISNNIAGSSYHRITMDAVDVDTIIGDGFNYYGIFDLISRNNYFYSDIYNQKLVICSSIISKSNLTAITLTGDFFYSNFTFRDTAPLSTYRYGDNDITLQDPIHTQALIVSVGIESRFNLKGRFSGENDYQKVFSIESIADMDNLSKFASIPYTHDNFINTPEGKGYSLNANNNGYDYNTYEKELDTKYHFFNRVVRSNVNSIEAKALGWFKYDANSYIDMPIDRGPINIIESDDTSVYIQQAHALSVAFVKDVISNTKTGATYLGSGDIFDRPPTEILFEKTGYIGCDNRFGAIVTPFGYCVVDSVKKNIYLVKQTVPTKLNDLNVEDWFNGALTSGLMNPYAGEGVTLLYDDIIKSIFLTQQDGDSILDFTIHYNVIQKGWLSYHEYLPDMYMSNRTTSYCIKDKKIYERNAESKCIYFDTVKQSVAIYMYNPEFETYKQICGIAWDTLIRVNNRVLYNRTIDGLTIFNDTQCTGAIDVNKSINWFDHESGIYKKDSWFFNEVFDMVVSDLEAFIDADYDLIPSNINMATKNWFEKHNFLCKYIAIKLVYDNKFVNITTNETSDVVKAEYNQLSFILNSYDVNAIKALR